MDSFHFASNQKDNKMSEESKRILKKKQNESFQKKMSSKIRVQYNNKQLSLNVSPSTLLSQVVEEVCKQLDDKFDPLNFYLVYQKKEVELSLNWRQSGLPSNTLVELKYRVLSSTATVKVALQTPSGTRLTDTFPLRTTLWSLLLFWEQKEKVNFTKLKGKKRNSKGEEEGEEGYMQPICQFNNLEFNTNLSLSSTSFASLGFRSGSLSLRLFFSFSPNLLLLHFSPPPPLSNPPQQDTSINSVINNNDSVINNNVSVINNSHTLKIGEEEKREEQLKKEAQLKRMEEAKREQIRKEEQMRKEEQKKEQKKIEEHVERKGEMTEGKGETERRGIVFVPSEKPARLEEIGKPEEEEEEEMEVSESEFKEFASIAPGENWLLKGKEKEIMTKTKREELKEKAYLKFKKTNIRVRFPDRFELQATFSSKEGIEQLYHFVSLHLNHPNKQFFFYTTPPKTILPLNSSFLQLRLVPAAIVYFSFKEPLPPSLPPPPLGQSHFLASSSISSLLFPSPSISSNPPPSTFGQSSLPSSCTSSSCTSSSPANNKKAKKEEEGERMEDDDDDHVKQNKNEKGKEDLEEKNQKKEALLNKLLKKK